jgi:hypothetical protein
MSGNIAQLQADGTPRTDAVIQKPFDLADLLDDIETRHPSRAAVWLLRVAAPNDGLAGGDRRASRQPLWAE